MAKVSQSGCRQRRKLPSKLAKLDIAKPLKNAVAAQPRGVPQPQLDGAARVDTPVTDDASTVHRNTAPGSGE
ncbi:hypothetical protein VTO73DRAFT_10248 [Trametes versicolor]